MEKKKNLLKRFFVPAKESGDIGMYQRTLVYSNWALLIFIALSLFLEIIGKGQNGWLNFFETYAIGAACSIIIVIITTVVQFKSKRNDGANDFLLYSNKIADSLFWVKRYSDTFGKERAKPYATILLESTQEYKKKREELIWFNPETDEMYAKVAKELDLLANRFEMYPDDVYNLKENEIKDTILDVYRFFILIHPDRKMFVEQMIHMVEIGMLGEVEQMEEKAKKTKEEVE